MKAQNVQHKNGMKLKGQCVAILATDGFEERELFEPKKALEDAGAEVDIVSLKSGKITAWNKDKWGKAVAVDVLLGRAHPDKYSALVLPGGVMNPDALRMEPKAVAFVKSFAASNKPIAAICHGPWTLIETGFAKGKKLTSWPSLKTDLKNAGAKWVDQEVVVDHGWVTSRKPQDLPAFNKKMIEKFAEGNNMPHWKLAETFFTEALQ